MISPDAFSDSSGKSQGQDPEPEIMDFGSRACGYRARGFHVLPLRGKDPSWLGQGWQNLRLDPAEHPNLFNGKTTGLGVLLGASGLVDLEADCTAAGVVLERLAPGTGCVWEHAGRKHRLYRAEAKHRTWSRPRWSGEIDYDEEKAMLVEVRAGNHQSVLPPSLHPEDGLRYQWVIDDVPSEAQAPALYRAATLAAVAGAMALKWPRGSRQNAALALAGCLRRYGATVEEAEAVLLAIGAATQDEETEKRLSAVRDTYSKAEGEPITGLPTLASLFPEELVNWLQRHLPRPKKADGGREPSQATRLIGVARQAELFHTPGADPDLYATVTVDGRRVTALLRSRAFRRWLSHQLYQSEGKTPSADALKDAITVLEAQAEFEGAAIPVYTRLAELEGAIYLDLANDRGEVVQITSSGWQVRTDAPIRFRQPKGMLPLPSPVAGGWINELRPLINIGSDADWALLKAWLLQAYRHRGPYPVLALNGEQGSAKTTLAVLLRRLLDPHQSPLRSEPREIRDLAIAASNNWCVAFDNLSHIPPWLSDALCRLSTGGGFSTRALYTNDDEWIFDGQRPVLLTSIEDVVTRSDLLDRAVLLNLPPITHTRKTEDQLYREFEAARPRILGALLKGVSAALRSWDGTALQNPPRMADFARWVVAAGDCIEEEKVTFLSAYTGNREAAHELALEGDPIVAPLRSLVEGYTVQHPWQGTATDLLSELKSRVDEAICRQRAWPGNARVLSGRLKRLAPNLRAAGIGVGRQKTESDKLISLWKEGKACDPCDPSDPAVPEGDTGLVSTEGPLVATKMGMVATAETSSSPDRACVAALVARVAPAPLPSGEPSTDQVLALRHNRVTCADQLAVLQEELTGASCVGVDLETTGLNPRRDAIRLLSLATPRSVWVVDCFKVDPRPLFQKLADVRLIGHNIGFDLGFLDRLGLPYSAATDTLILSRLLSAGQSESRGWHSLQAVAERTLGISLPKELQQSDWSGSLSTAQIEYAARDAAVLLPLAAMLQDQIVGAGLGRVAEIEARCLPAMVWMGAAGVPFSAPAWDGLMREAAAESRFLAAELNAMGPKKHGLDLGMDWNWNSPKEVLTAFKAIGRELTDTSDETLATCDHPLALLLRRYRAAQKLATSYGSRWLEAVDGARIYPKWQQIGPAAGRMSCRHPNIQQMPRDPRYRACVASLPHRVLVKADYSQIELRIAAKIADDQHMINAYQSGEDLHTLTARQLLGKECVSKADRQLAKAVNFGLVYGMGAEGFQRYSAVQYGIPITLAQALSYRTAFFQSYPGLASWHRRVKQENQTETRTLCGRRRLLTDQTVVTQRLNTPVQGTGADGLKRSLALLYERRHCCPGAIPVIACHDEIVVECDADKAETAAAWLQQAMLDGMAPLITPVPVELETQISPTWAAQPVADRPAGSS